MQKSSNICSALHVAHDCWNGCISHNAVSSSSLFNSSLLPGFMKIDTWQAVMMSKKTEAPHKHKLCLAITEAVSAANPANQNLKNTKTRNRGKVLWIPCYFHIPYSTSLGFGHHFQHVPRSNCCSNMFQVLQTCMIARSSISTVPAM